jgi:hypothetical protein
MAFSPATQTLAFLGSRVIEHVSETKANSHTPIRLLTPANGNAQSGIADPYGTQAMAFSPDGSLLAFAGEYTARRQYAEVGLWSVTTKRELWKHTIPYIAFHAVAFSPDGKIVATGGYDLKLWDPATGKEIEKLEEGQRYVPSRDERRVGFFERMVWPEPEGHGHLAFSPDGRMLATCGPGTSVILWELATGRKRRQFAGHEVSCMAFSPDSRLLATGGTDTLVMAWDVTGRIQKGRLQSGPVDTRALEAQWHRLADQDAGAAFDAVWGLVAAGNQVMPFLRARLPVICKTDHEGAHQLVADLGAEELSVRQRAMEKLEALGVAAEDALWGCLEEQPHLEVRLRVEGLLRKAQEAGGLNANPALRRGLRLVEVLEQMGSAEAKDALGQLVERASLIRLRQEAHEALVRLGKRPVQDTAPDAPPTAPGLQSQPARLLLAEVIGWLCTALLVLVVLARLRRRPLPTA